ncbi:S26 family signal peptidase [Catellatospora bangladeshensis]|uniref:S26 family signal peptidase n=1 Tax=Catellatospora bangladeshensis TaxID=310355 RepID=UPI003609F84C
MPGRRRLPQRGQGRRGLPGGRDRHGVLGRDRPGGEIYVLGDHREASRDSRQLGTLAAAGVTGRVLTRMWPVRPAG